MRIKIPLLNSFVIPVLQLQKEGNWHRATFYDSLGTEPISVHQQALPCSELPPRKQPFFLSPLSIHRVSPCQGQNQAQEERSHLYQYHRNLSIDKFNIMNEINILFLTQLSREKKLRLLLNTSLRCMEITRVECKEASMPCYACQK